MAKLIKRREKTPVVANPGGCPCCKTCCSAPRIIWPHTECGPDCEAICEAGYEQECLNCGAACRCDL